MDDSAHEKHTTSMTIVDTLKDKLKEELEGFIEYGELYDHFTEKGMHREASLIQEIANDEYTHAKALCRHLNHLGYDTSKDEEISNMWRDANALLDY